MTPVFPMSANQGQDNVVPFRPSSARLLEFHFFGSALSTLRLQNRMIKFARTRGPILITGETGTGKTALARAIHKLARGENAPFVDENCTAIPQSLLESILFGHVKGSFTGASAEQKGLIQQAQGGTLFLDEIGDMELGLQSKLFRLLDQGSFRMVGNVKELHSNALIIAATNQNLYERFKKGQFRQDLFYRLRVMTLEVPPLRERKEDIVPLAEHFLQIYEGAGRYFAEDAKKALMAYAWPGNVRELASTVQRAKALADDSEIFPEHLEFLDSASAEFQNHDPLAVPSQVELPQKEFNVKKFLRGYERRIYEAALKRSGGNQKLAADMIGTSARVFDYRKKILGVEPENFRPWNIN